MDPEDTASPVTAPLRGPPGALGLVPVHRAANPGVRYLPPHHALWPGNRCQLLRDGVEAYPAMVQAIRSARRQVRLCTYRFADDEVGALFSRELVEAAERGVRVAVLYDAFGSLRTRRAFFTAMRGAGVDVRPFNPLALRPLARLLHRDHRKLLVVDGQVAFTGGINLASQWAPIGRHNGQGWRDDVVLIEGPAVIALERCFKASWRLQVTQRLLDLRDRGRARPVEGPAPAGAVSLAVLSSRRSIYEAYLRAFERAHTSIRLVAAYFVPDRRMLQALTAALDRDVRVELILNRKWDHPILHFATRAYYERLLSRGAQIYEWCDAVLHGKTAVVDGCWGTVGSFNLERASFRLNHELNVAFADRELGARLERSFREDAARATAVELATFRRRPLWQKLLERVLFRFRRFI